MDSHQRELFQDKIKPFLTAHNNVAWDRCHKTYLFDDSVRSSFEGYPHLSTRVVPDRTLALLENIFESSCSLRFIQYVTKDPNNDSLIFSDVIEQCDPDFLDEDTFDEEIVEP